MILELRKKHQLIEHLNDMRTRSVLLYGTGVFSDRLLSFLQETGIHPHAFLVDDKYYSAPTHRGYSVFPIDGYFNAELGTRFIENKPVVIVTFVNYDESRFSVYEDRAELLCCDLQGLFPIGQFDYMSPDYLFENSAALEWVEGNLEDEVSRNHLFNYLLQKCYGTYRTPYNPCQYFMPDLINLSDGEVFVDCGAFDGDSVLSFVDALCKRGIDRYQKIIAFEPDENNQAKFLKSTSELKQVNLVCGGVWSCNDTLHFSGDLGASSGISDRGGVDVQVYSIDEVLNGEKATYIKMDIEGSEIEALRGAETTIRKWHPKLAVCLYHKREDLLTIPQFIKQISPDYKLYLRKHASSAMELVLYAL